jgi:Tol biopolymer transport system component
MRTDGSDKQDFVRVYGLMGDYYRLSPDRKKIVISAGDTLSARKIQNRYVFDSHHLWLIEGTKGIQLTGLIERNVDDVPAAWSKDGKTIYYLHDRNTQNEGYGQWEIWAINVDGSNPRRITDGSYLSVSPDGNTLAVFRQRYIESQHINTVSFIPETVLTDSDGSNLRMLANGPSYCEWSPDGLQLACRDEGTDHIVLLNAKGDRLKELPYATSISESFAWSPDGQWLIYFDVLGNEGSGLWKVRVDGSSPPVLLVLLADEGVKNGSPQWLP